ncbi:MAG: hypothetical protein M0T79_04490 [Actinomycetota bacterium]|nr:hypothetical protein [Actinomycetota bacterium]
MSVSFPSPAIPYALIGLAGLRAPCEIRVSDAAGPTKARPESAMPATTGRHHALVIFVDLAGPGS